MAKITQTAGRNALGEFAPQFAHFNDDVLFGENWNNEDIDVKTRSIITVVALMAQGITGSSLKFHLQNAKAHGVTQKEIAAIITHVAFYAGWPNGWAVFNLAKEVWDVDEGDLPYEDPAMRAHAKEMVFPIGQPNDAFAQYFIGQSYLAPVSTSQVGIFNVTFEPGCSKLDYVASFSAAPVSLSVFSMIRRPFAVSSFMATFWISAVSATSKVISSATT